MHRKALGRGLDALIPTGSPATVAEPASGVREIPIQDVGMNPFQPRKRFDEEAIRDLSASIKASGVLQPIIVRSVGDGFQIVAGERRLRAASLAGLGKIPAIVRDATDREMLEYALVENIQRENLNPIEEARAYQGLIDQAKLTHDQISERVGKQRVTVTNALRLLGLPPEIQDMVSRGTLSAGHARAIIGLDAKDLLAAARYVSAKGFSVRRTEAYVRRKQRGRGTRQQTARKNGLGEWEEKLQQRFSTHVALQPGRKGGKVVFEYYGQEDLERLLEAWGVL
jgi:ParB family chromosome partitioning protein